MRKSVGFALALGVGVLSIAGCNRQPRDRVGDPDDTHVAASRATRSAVRSIADARCDREARCKNIGADAKFASRNACLERVKEDWAADLNAHECPHGVREVELDECLQDIRDEECGNPFDSLDRLFSCGTAEICSD